MNVYAKAAIATTVVFISGIVFGMWLDETRLSSVRNTITKIETDLSDARLLSEYIQKLGGDACNSALSQNLAFNQKIYQDGLSIENAIEASGMTPDLEQEQRKYVLLQTTFWLNSIELKYKCSFNYSNVVHLFDQKDLTREEAIDNKLQSGVMLDLKEKCGSKIMLIPLAADLDLSVTDAIIKQHNIQKLPAVMIDSDKIFQGVTSLDELNNVTKC